MGKRELNKEENRGKILEAGKIAFSKHGYHNTSISDIIRQTGLSRGTFYLYFKDKREIFETLSHKLFRAMVLDLNKIKIENNKKTTPEQSSVKLYSKELKERLRTLFSTLHRHKELTKIFLNSPVGLDDDFDSMVERYLNILLASTRSIIKKSQQAGIVETDNIELISHLIFGAFKEIILQWLVKDNYQNIEKDTEIILDFILYGISKNKIHKQNR